MEKIGVKRLEGEVELTTDDNEWWWWKEVATRRQVVGSSAKPLTASGLPMR